MLRIRGLAAMLAVAGLIGLVPLSDWGHASSSSAVEPEKKTEKPADPIERIKEEGEKRSQVMVTLGTLTDVIGPRLTGSPALKRANEWTRDRMAEWGLENAHLEPWGPFGRGWTLKRFSAQMIEPHGSPLIAFPKAWSPSLEGVLTAEVIHFDAESEADFEKYKGKFKGAIVLMSPPADIAARFEPLARRKSDKQLLDLADAPEPSAAGPRPASPRPPAKPDPEKPISPAELLAKKRAFLADEEPALLIEPSRKGDGGTVFVQGADVIEPISDQDGEPFTPKRPRPWLKDSKVIPQLVMAQEHYNRMVRMLAAGETIKMAVELTADYHEEDPNAYNTIAEIPGTDLKEEIVMLGAHLDSWHGATGTTDNAAGCSVVMEAARIIKALDLKPRRTIRVALWTGEEQGLLGSRAYVDEHFRKRGEDGEVDESEGTKPEYDLLSGYFNLDNGTGKIRGVYLQGNEAVRPIFRKWLQPFKNMGAQTLSIANTGATDHVSFDAVGLPGFQFIQDEIEYPTRTHHSNMDVFDRAQADDLKQASIIMAAFVYNTAMMDEKLPRKPSPAPKPEAEAEAESVPQAVGN